MKHSSSKTKSGKATDTLLPSAAEPSSAKASPSASDALAATELVDASVEPSSPTSAGAPEADASDAPSQEMSPEDRIRHSAYLRYLGRGGDTGGEVDDWLRAESEHASK